ncbi:MAG: C2H2 type zinc finger domain-containing protein [Thermoplasmatota archaeon]
MTACPVCKQPFADLDAAARHFLAEADRSEGRHVMWLNRKVSMRELPFDALRAALARL